MQRPTRKGETWRKFEYGGDKYRNKNWRGISCRKIEKKLKVTKMMYQKKRAARTGGKDRYKYGEITDDVTGI